MKGLDYGVVTVAVSADGVFQFASAAVNGAASCFFIEQCAGRGRDVGHPSLDVVRVSGITDQRAALTPSLCCY